MREIEQAASLGHAIAHLVWRTVRWLLVGISSFVLFMMSASAFGSGQKVVIFGILALWGISWCSILFHESGHAIAGAFAGWRTIVFAVKPLSWNTLTRRLGRAQWVDGGNARDVGGWVVAIPKSSAAVTRVRYAVFVAGGPLANALLAVAAFWAAARWLPAYDHCNLSISTLAATTGFVSAAVAIFNLFPNARSGILSDGDILRRTLLADAEWHQRILIGSSNSMTRYGARPRDRPKWLTDALRSIDNPEAVRAAAALDISAALDSPPIDAPQVRAQIGAFRVGYGDSEWLALCDAYLAAVWENDVAGARAVRWHDATTDDQRPLRLAVDAAIAAREGEHGLATDLLREMRVAASAEPWMRSVFRDIDDQVQSLIVEPASLDATMLPKSLTC